MAFLPAACAPDGSSRASAIARDSAGVRIIESSAPQWPVSTPWLVGATPELNIGAQSGEPAYEFFRIVDARRLSDGRIVILDAGSQDARLFGVDGKHLRTIATAGPGPGELQSPRSVSITTGDSLTIIDRGAMIRFSSEGDFVDATSVGPGVVARFADGSTFGVGFAAGQNQFEVGHARPNMALIRTAANSASPDTLAVLPGFEEYRLQVVGGMSSYQAPFGLQLLTHIHGSSIYVGDGSTFEVRELDSTGEITRIIRRTTARDALDADDIEAYEQEFVAIPRNPEQLRRSRQVLAEWSYPGWKPAYDRLLVDSEGNVWVRQYATGLSQSRTWTVFDGAGVWLGEIDLPDGLRVTQIGSSFVLGVATDELGVEYVNLHALSKQP
jgi:hypothetical protein